MQLSLNDELKRKGLLGSFGSLSSEKSDLIKRNEDRISRILKRSKSLKGLGDVSDKTLSVEESVIRFNKENGLMSDDEIKAWVFYKQSIGIPMDGWERWFPKDTEKCYLLKTIKSAEIQDKNFVSMKIVPSGTILGECIESLDDKYEGWSFFTSKCGDIQMVRKGDVKKEVSLNKKGSEKERDKMVKGGYLFYNQGRYLPFAIYTYANIYDRLLELEADKDFIIEKYGESVYDNQKKVLDGVKPKMLSFLDPIRDNRPQISPLSDYASSFEVGELSDTCPMNFEYKFQENEQASLLEIYLRYLTSRLPQDHFTYATIDGHEIYEICFYKRNKKKDEDKELFELKKGRCYAENERLFALFIEECITFADKQRLDFDWNRKFNGFPNLQVNKVPIGLKMSKYVRGQEFDLRPAQREGVAFMEIAGSGCISYDVGVGKTFTALAELSCAIAQGRCKRPLVIVPNQTYKNWVMEIEGNKEFNGLLSNIGVKFNYLYNLGGGKLFNAKNIENNSITLVTYEGFEKIGLSIDSSEEVVENLVKILQVTTPETTAKEYIKFKSTIDDISGRVRVGTKYDIDELGFDYIVFDEAHRAKNIFSKVKASTSKKSKGFKGGGNGIPSARGLRAFFLCNYIQRKFGGNVMLLTATPFTNTPLEIYSMLSLVANEDLYKRGLENVHAFFDTFVNETYEEIVDSKLDITNGWIVKSFKNKVILQSLIYSKFNYKTGEEAGVKRPTKINLPLLYKNGDFLPKEKQVLTYLRLTERQAINQDIINFIFETASKSVNKKGQNSQLSGLSSSLDNALSPFLFKVKPELETRLKMWKGLKDEDIAEINREPADMEEFIEESPKIKYTCQCVKSIYDWHKKRGEKCSGVVIYSNRGKEYFRYIKGYLEELCGFGRGFDFIYEDFEGKKKNKVDEVMIIDGSLSAEKKDVVMRAFNEGVVKVVIGTASIKEGVNLQKTSTCLFDMYPEWNPTDMQQLEGRVYRQGNKHQYVRIVIPLMQDSMDTFVFQKLQEKTDRINDIWYRSDRGNVLNVDSLDPKEVKFALMTDIDKLTESQIGKEKEDAYREILLIKEQITGLNNFSRYKQNLDYYRRIVIDDIRRTLDNMGRFVDCIVNRPNEDDFKKMSAEEREKTKKTLERYDELMSFISNSKLTDDKEIIAMSRKAKNLYPSHNSFNTDTMVQSLKNVSKAEESILKKRGFDRNSDLNEVLSILKAEKEKAEKEYEHIDSDDYYHEVYNFIAKKKKQMNIVGKSIEDRIKEFEKTNFVMSIQFDPTKSIPNNTIPSEDGMEQEDEQDGELSEEEEIELLELEAEALILILRLKGDEKKKVEDKRKFVPRFEDYDEEMMKKTFGFRYIDTNINFTNDEEQEMLNVAYDAFYLLSLVLGKPEGVISLGGFLNLEIGTRQMGDNVGAYYSPRLKDITFRQKSDFKHIAHEWFHGLDHFLSFEYETKDETDGQYQYRLLLSEINERKRNDNWEGRGVVLDNFNNIIDCIHKSDYYQKSLSVTQATGNNYWSTDWEMMARAFEVYVDDSLKEFGLPSNNNLVELISGNPYPDYSNPTCKPIKDAFREFFDALEVTNRNEKISLGRTKKR